MRDRHQLAVVLVNHIVDCYEDSTPLVSLAMLEQARALRLDMLLHRMQQHSRTRPRRPPAGARCARPGGA